MASLERTAGLSVDPLPTVQPVASTPDTLRIGPHVPVAWRGENLNSHANDDAYAVVDRLFRDQSLQIQRNARQHAKALRRLSSLRRVNEDLQNCFAALERVLPADTRGMSLVYADEPAAAKLRLGWSSCGLAQTLPVSSTGVSAIELFLGDVHASAHGKLHVHLVGLENHAVIDRWTVPLDEIVSGWTMFCLNRPIVGPTRTLELRLDVECEADVNVSLSLGQSPTIAMFRARDPAGDKVAAEYGLAMKVWCGDAEGAFARHANVVVADGRSASASGLVEVPLSPTLMQTVAHATSESVRFDFEPVTYIPYRVAVGVHPPARGLTAAVVRLPVDVVVFSAMAELQVGHEKANPVDFAMVLATDFERAAVLLEDPLQALAFEASSGWVTSGFGERQYLEAKPEQPTTRELKLFLATRMREPGTHHFAWARFRDLRLRVLG